MQKFGGNRPDFYFRFRLFGTREGGFREILPFKKHWPAILIVGILLGGSSVPLFFTMNMDFANAEDLFDLTSSLFQLFWLFGWSLGVLALLAIFLLLLCAREVLIVEPGSIKLRFEILGLGFETHSPTSNLNNLHYVNKQNTSTGMRWRGNHLAINNLDTPIHFGSNFSEKDASSLINRINSTLKTSIPGTISSEMRALARKNESSKISRDNELSAANIQQKVFEKEAFSPDSKFQNRNSLYLLCLANLIPLAGALTLGWDIADIMILFWLESAIIGFFNILKMFKISGPVAIFYSIFFTGHFGAFMSVHLMFLFGLFIEEEGSSSSLTEVALIFKSLWPAILGLFVSHAYSFKANFLGKKEYLTLTIKDQMQKPYSRVVLMHITLIVGGILVLALDAQVLALTLLIGMKITADARAHIKEHN